METIENTIHHPQDEAQRRLLEGQLYYVQDDASPQGWSIVEINGVADGVLAGFVVGQLEAIPLDELMQRMIGPVPAPPLRIVRAA